MWTRSFSVPLPGYVLTVWALKRLSQESLAALLLSCFNRIINKKALDNGLGLEWLKLSLLLFPVFHFGAKKEVVFLLLGAGDEVSDVHVCVTVLLDHRWKKSNRNRVTVGWKKITLECIEWLAGSAQRWSVLSSYSPLHQSGSLLTIFLHIFNFRNSIFL